MRSLYFIEKQEYLEAFNLKQEKIQIEHQYGLRAFIGASQLQPQRYKINSVLEPQNIPFIPEEVAHEIDASGRQQDVNRLIERLTRADYKLTVVHGHSGVGKSSLLKAGLLPTVKNKLIGERVALPIVTEVLNVKKNPIKRTQNMVILGEDLKYISLIMIINSFPKIVKDILKSLPKNDYPVLNSRLFFECWLSYALDNSLTSMRDLFQRLNNTGFQVDILTFSKASSHRAQKPFQKIYQKLNELVQKKTHKKLHNKYAICPIDSTIITLTSKLLWVLGHHQVKLFSSLNLATGSPEDNFINFGHEHDYKFGSKMMSSLPTNAVDVMDRGFAGLKFIQELVQENKYFVLRIKNNWKLEFEEQTGLIKVGASDDAQTYRVINFCDLETKTEFRLVTNLPASGEADVSDDEIRDIYRLRWGVELLWKFLKMHLKLDKLITKNFNGITIQIYVSLIAYLILQILSIPAQWGNTLLDKFRYLQSCMCQKISYVH
ncbi:transposase, IS4 family protein [Nostoc sp. NIES-3756]|nr:transposase, IS4 family protein [Nostoc sp. NIES-3756]